MKEDGCEFCHGDFARDVVKDYEHWQVQLFEDQYYLQGFEPEMTYGGERWIRLASLRPETIDYVEFFRNGEPYYTAYDEPYSVHFRSNWRQGGVTIGSKPEQWEARIHLVDGRTVERRATAEGT